MKNNKTTAILMLLVFLLVAAVVLIFLTGLDNASRRDTSLNNITNNGDVPVSSETPTPTPTPTPAVTVLPTPASTYAPSATYAPSSTARPVTQATPPPAAAATPTATATPSPAPTTEDGMPILPAEELIPVIPGANDSSDDGTATIVPTGTSLGSGTFRSDSGAKINIHADWTAVIAAENTVNVTVTVYVDSYSLTTTEAPEALDISVDGQFVALGSPAIQYDGTAQRSTLINSHTFSVNVPAGQSRTIPIEVVWQFRGNYGGVQLDIIECGGSVTLNR